MKTLRFSVFVACLFGAFPLLGEVNGKLQIHFIDVGQGDCALLVSPQGKTVLFDCGDQADKVLAYLQQIGETRIDYFILSHFHDDHYGAVPKVFKEIAIPSVAYDRGGEGRKSYNRLLGNVRKTPEAGTSLILDEGTANPIRIEFVALNGNGIPTKDENDLSIVSVVHYGKFDAEIGGDLSGYHIRQYKDIETSVAPKVGKVEVYKVHHHGSDSASNSDWISTLQPKIAIISCGDGNRFGHPVQSTLETLHTSNVKIYWTEYGNGARPESGKDIAPAGTILVEVPQKGETFTVRTSLSTEAFTSWDVVSTEPDKFTADLGDFFVWSKKAKVYHYGDCRYCKAISAENFQTGKKAPEGMTLHEGCPR